MFFPRLRNQAKWAFVFLILVFAGGFVFLGVGSGGLDLGQLLRDAFGNKGPSTGSLSKAQEKVRERPFNAIARRKLAEVLEKKGRTEEAIAAWLEYGKLRSKDVGALRHLGELEFRQATRYSAEAQIAYLAQQQAGVGSPFRPSWGKFGEALGQNPIVSALGSSASTQLQDASAKYQTAASQAVATYERIAKLQPKSQQALLSLAQTADSLHQNAVAVRAYRRLLQLDLDRSEKAQIRARIKTLRQASPTGG
jgi:tetratricopeptide (TPR) repeat protein